MNLVIKDGKIYQELEMEVLVREYEELKLALKKTKKLIEIENIIQRLKQIKIKKYARSVTHRTFKIISTHKHY